MALKIPLSRFAFSFSHTKMQRAIKREKLISSVESSPYSTPLHPIKKECESEAQAIREYQQMYAKKLSNMSITDPDFKRVVKCITHANDIVHKMFQAI